MERIVEDLIIKNNNIVAKTNFMPQDIFLYEVIRVQRSIPIFLKEHYDRFVKSHNGKCLDCNFENFQKCVSTLIKANNITDCNIKVLDDDRDLYFIFIKSHYPDAETHKRGIDVLTANLMRSNPNKKQVNKELRSTSDKLISEHNVFEVLLVSDNQEITEGSRSNVFFIKDNIIYTAPDDKVLIGVTRNKVIEVINSLGIEIRYTALKKDELPYVDGAFLTGTSIDVFKIKSIDGRGCDRSAALIEKIAAGFLMLGHGL